MSGEAGWQVESEHYSIFVGTGVCVNIAGSPGDGGSAITSYFDRVSAPFPALARARQAGARRAVRARRRRVRAAAGAVLAETEAKQPEPEPPPPPRSIWRRARDWLRRL